MKFERRERRPVSTRRIVWGNLLLFIVYTVIGLFGAPIFGGGVSLLVLWALPVHVFALILLSVFSVAHGEREKASELFFAALVVPLIGFGGCVLLMSGI